MVYTDYWKCAADYSTATQTPPGRDGTGGGGPVSRAAAPAADALLADSTAAWSISGPPPRGNTGGKFTNGLTIKLDWLNSTFASHRLKEVRAFATATWGRPEEVTFGRHTYEMSERYPGGAVLFWTESKPRAEFLLSINGDALDLIPQAEQLAFLRRFEDMGAKCTRVDVALDDYSRQLLDLEAIAAAADAGNFSQFRRKKVTREQQRLGGRMIDTGFSIDWGRRGKDGSGVSVQVYDKGLESKGEIDSNRFEVRFAKERAKMLGECLFGSSTDESLVEKLRNAVGGAIDFIDRAAGDANLSRCPRLGWWQQLLDVLGRARHVVKRAVPPLQRFVEWFKRSVAGQLSVVRAVFNSAGQDFEHFTTWALDLAEPRACQHNGKRALGLDFRACYSP